MMLSNILYSRAKNKNIGFFLIKSYLLIPQLLHRMLVEIKREIIKFVKKNQEARKR